MRIIVLGFRRGVFRLVSLFEVVFEGISIVGVMWISVVVVGGLVCFKDIYFEREKWYIRESGLVLARV